MVEGAGNKYGEKGKSMKGILLAGGSGTRLYPLTKVVCKQLLPVYDKPMVSYPLSTLMLMGITEIMVISSPSDLPLIEAYLGDGSRFGISLSYKVQPKPAGIAEAFLLADSFIGNEPVCLILGDNIFHLGDQLHDIRKQVKNLQGAVVFGYHVKDPHRFGVIEFQKDGTVLSLEEKPASPKSSYAAVGLYFYPADVVAKARALKPSPRGELEITDINKAYLDEKRLKAIQIKRGAAWLDAGTPESLLDASNYIGAIEHRQGLKVACIEEVAYRMGFISEPQLRTIIAGMSAKSPYAQYLGRVFYE